LAVGLQQTDGLTPSEYLIETAKQNIDGNITMNEVKERLDTYYKANPVKNNDRTEEADKVSARIAEILSERACTFSPAGYITIHKRLFAGLYKHAGKIRDYNITKAEWVLNGETVIYAGAEVIKAALDYDFSMEKDRQYKGSSKKEMAKQIAKFVSDIWQTHAFGEGNTRTTAVFVIKYLRALGFDPIGDTFTENSRYFRNALVRANYNDFKKDIFSTTEYLDRFFGNLLFGENNVLRNRDLHVNADSG
jgi:fido (protein-threonine AMPylation protein)